MNDEIRERKGIWLEITQWSVGRIIIVLVIVTWILKLNIIQNLHEKFLFTALLLAVLFEIFQLLLNKFFTLEKRSEKIFFGTLMAVSVIGILVFAYYYLSPAGRG